MLHDKVLGLTDMDWSEIAAASGQQIHPDQLRKMGAGVKLVIEAGV